MKKDFSFKSSLASVQVRRNTHDSSSEIGSPKFILWAIFREEFRRPNQCLVAFGDYATGRYQHCFCMKMMSH